MVKSPDKTSESRKKLDATPQLMHEKRIILPTWCREIYTQSMRFKGFDRGQYKSNFPT
jgi:hypothetical protein